MSLNRPFLTSEEEEFEQEKECNKEKPSLSIYQIIKLILWKWKRGE